MVLDALTAAQAFPAAGIETQRAEARARAMSQARGIDLEQGATKAAPYRALWLPGAGIVTLVAAVSRLRSEYCPEMLDTFSLHTL